MEPVLRVEGIGKTFKDTRVLSNIAFDVHKGEIMAILGPNGAGKSTTIRNIMGIMYPDEGQIVFPGYEGKALPRHRIGYLPEERGLYKGVSVLDIILYFAELKDYPIKKAKERALSYLEKFDLKGKEKSKVEELSKGMAQKVQFIASVIHEPELLILDEPFSGLDPVSQDLFKKEIRELANKGTAILLSSHQMNLVEEMCDRLFMIYKGERIIYGKIQDVKEQYANYKCTLVGSNEEASLQALPSVTRVESSGDKAIVYLDHEVEPAVWLRSLPETVDIRELSIARVSLHEIFIDVAQGKKQGGTVHA
ncbi:ABC transporter ATP-binding protein [Paenalkalicoccus suaedae]|uniref:ABC transporter ATP-binding protein n=1 Tax=Paenalkalicoccus suaedae TaxID=2592382 RepID=A0A859FC07_9BACI|nr:ATP-binding cassette domain-containing protein [Paenalkalicoccus suaedae]QKS70084.1 ABC transporter ATP-binding protein [Paenalkalicoccus suaedae]